VAIPTSDVARDRMIAEDLALAPVGGETYGNTPTIEILTERAIQDQSAPVIGASGPNWSEIDRVLNLPGNEVYRQRVADAMNRPAIEGPSLFRGTPIEVWVTDPKRAFDELSSTVKTAVIIAAALVGIIGLTMLTRETRMLVRG
jgi:hypothetical protein